MTTSGSFSEDFESIKIHLPQYLSGEKFKDLFKNIDDYISAEFRNDNVFSLEPKNYIMQGDGFKELPFTNLPSPEIKNQDGIVVSNTCDLFSENKGIYSSRVQYCPIIKLSNYKEVLLKKFSSQQVSEHIKKIKKQHITQLFYLPSSPLLGEERIALLDRINNSPSEVINLETINEQRIYSLNNFGFYIFLLKLSIHFTRVREEIDRG